MGLDLRRAEGDAVDQVKARPGLWPLVRGLLPRRVAGQGHADALTGGNAADCTHFGEVTDTIKVRRAEPG
ncbi:hypothetical protein ACFVX6_11720 [Streptomyces sp. NPDC058289]|uniref:hypothetical protein n=1 Tax=Streptomyces sp. NPDC058289 TaxID=3346425 RepID=UPI0036E6FD52